MLAQQQDCCSDSVYAACFSDKSCSPAFDTLLLLVAACDLVEIKSMCLLSKLAFLCQACRHRHISMALHPSHNNICSMYTA